MTFRRSTTTTADPADTGTEVRSEPRGSRAAAVAADATAGFTTLVTRLIHLVASVVAAILAVQIVLRIVGAHHSNAIVNRIGIWAHWLANPFVGMFSLHSAKWTMVLNYGVALVVYLVVAQLLIALILALTSPARRFPRYGSGRPVVR